jgi:hypothetical protein
LIDPGKAAVIAPFHNRCVSRRLNACASSSSNHSSPKSPAGAAEMSKPTLEMLSPQNWAALFTGTTGAHLKLASSSNYTVTNAEGVEIEIKGDNLKTTDFFGVHVLSGGTITGFDLF